MVHKGQNMYRLLAFAACCRMLNLKELRPKENSYVDRVHGAGQKSQKLYLNFVCHCIFKSILASQNFEDSWSRNTTTFLRDPSGAFVKTPSLSWTAYPMNNGKRFLIDFHSPNRTGLWNSMSCRGVPNVRDATNLFCSPPTIPLLISKMSWGRLFKFVCKSQFRGVENDGENLVQDRCSRMNSNEKMWTIEGRGGSAVVQRKLQTRKLHYSEEEDIENAASMNSKSKPPLLTFRVIGCSSVSICVGVTLIIYVTSGMFYPDCLTQICSEVCLLGAYICILLTTTEHTNTEKGLCKNVAILLHFLFLAFFLFLLLEVLCMCTYLLSIFPASIFRRTSFLFVTGFGIPAVITGMTALAASKKYTTKTNCWLDMDNVPMWPTVIPIGICVGLHVILIIVALLIPEVPNTLTDSEYRRAQSIMTTRWASAIIIILATVSWACGTMASHTGKEMYFAAFTVASIVLGVFILILRISTDLEVRASLTTFLLCYFVGSRNKISSWSEKIFHVSTKPLPTVKSPKNAVWMTNGNRALHK